MYAVVDGITTQEDLLPCLNVLNEFVEGLSKMFHETMWGLCEGCLNHNDIEGYRAVQPTLLRRIARHSNELNGLHYRMIDALHRLNEDDESAEEEDDIDFEVEAIESVGNVVAEAIRASRKACFGLVKNFWIRDRFGGYEGEEEDNMQKRLVMIFDEELGYIDQLVKKLQIIKESNDDEEDEEDLSEPIVPFLEQQISTIYSDLLAQMKVMWGTASKEDRAVETTQFGLLIVDLVNAQLQDQDKGMTLVVIAGLFHFLAKYRDDCTFKELMKLLIDRIGTAMADLETLMGQELHLIWRIPENFKDDAENGNRMSEIQIEDVKEKIRAQYNDLSQPIDNQALQITESLRQCNDAVFIYKKFHGDVLPKEQAQDGESPEEEQEPEVDEFLEFSQDDVTFNEKTHEHLANLNKLLKLNRTGYH